MKYFFGLDYNNTTYMVVIKKTFASSFYFSLYNRFHHFLVNVETDHDIFKL